MIRNYSLTPFERVSLAIEKPQDPCGKLRTVIFAVAAIVGRDLAEKAARSNQYVGCITRARPIWSQSSRS